MAADRETVVVGGGAMGSATAWHLARRGRQVTLVERFGARHRMGASHGRSRNFNITYADATYQTMLREAAELWAELEDESGVSVLDVVGIVNHGAGVAPDLADQLGALGVRAALLTPAEAQERWAGIRFDTRVVHCPDGGRLDAEEAVATLQSEAARHGGEVVLDTRVESIEVRPDGRVEVVTGPETFVADTVVVTAGAWTEKLLGARVALPRLVVTQEQPAHFAVSDPAADWPSYNHLPEPRDPRYGYWYSQTYGTLTPGEGVKAGWHAVGPVTDPDARTFEPEPVQLAALQRYAREWLPGVDADAMTPISCTYTSTSDTDFVLDRVGPIVVGAGFSGHGFKFVPTVGRILADLVAGSAPAHARFSAARS
ncbi:MAG TPA: FAD-dependent oxidoreductase [Nocardioides sp.]|uniref:FAD-dependent oxidoreductase n=1 Tax=Nocardioides sp. TaxID=35761 RepID=UPI002E36F864|nr:FAD-dependent oxidoreductase [Nocardioides sp.]HEX5088678.1 FAD-dependent oxidoreductase [Nocardioides sp.]